MCNVYRISIEEGKKSQMIDIVYIETNNNSKMPQRIEFLLSTTTTTTNKQTKNGTNCKYEGKAPHIHTNNIIDIMNYKQLV